MPLAGSLHSDLGFLLLQTFTCPPWAGPTQKKCPSTVHALAGTKGECSRGGYQRRHVQDRIDNLQGKSNLWRAKGLKYQRESQMYEFTIEHLHCHLHFCLQVPMGELPAHSAFPLQIPIFPSFIIYFYFNKNFSEVHLEGIFHKIKW